MRLFQLRMRLCVWICAGALVTVLIGTASAQEREHIDQQHGFRVIIPDGWGTAPVAGRMVWHVADEQGSSMPDCSVVVSDDAEYSVLSADKYIQYADEQKVKKGMTLVFQDVVIGVWETGYRLGGAPALHYIFSGTLNDVRQTSLVLQTVRNRKLYTFTCNDEVMRFPFTRPQLMAVAESFSFIDSEEALVDEWQVMSVENDPDPGLVGHVPGSEPSTWFQVIFLAAIFVLCLFAPIFYTYRRAASTGEIGTLLRVLSYSLIVVVGACLSVLLVIAKVIGAGPLFFVPPFVFCLSHHLLLRWFLGKKCQVGVE